MPVATATTSPTARTGLGLLGGVPLRTHLTLWRAALLTELPGRWIWAAFLLVMWTIVADDGVETPSRIGVDVYLIVFGFSMSSVFILSQDGLRAFGVGRSAARAHRVMGGVVGVSLFLLLFLMMWSIWRIAGLATPDLLIVAVVVVVLSSVSGIFSLRKMNREVDEGEGKAKDNSRRDGANAGSICLALDPFTRMDKIAAKTRGHRRVLDTYANIGNRALIVTCAVMMLPVQTLLRGIFGVEATTTMLWVPLALVVVAMLIRMVQSELSLNQWLVFGGSREDWVRAVMRRAWEMPVGFALVFLAAAVLEWSLYDRLGWLTGSGAFPILHRTGPAEWLLATAAFAAMGAMLQAMVWISVAVTVMYPRQQWVGIALTTFFGPILLIAALLFMQAAAEDPATSWVVSGAVPVLVVVIGVGVVLSGVAAVALRKGARRASVQSHSAVTSYFGLQVADET